MADRWAAEPARSATGSEGALQGIVARAGLGSAAMGDNRRDAVMLVSEALLGVILSLASFALATETPKGSEGDKAKSDAGITKNYANMVGDL